LPSDRSIPLTYGHFNSKKDAANNPIAEGINSRDLSELNKELGTLSDHIDQKINKEPS